MQFCQNQLSKNSFRNTISVQVLGPVYMCLVVTCWERADLLALVCGVSLLLSHWYPGSGVVLDCIDSKFLHPLL